MIFFFCGFAVHIQNESESANSKGSLGESNHVMFSMIKLKENKAINNRRWDEFNIAFLKFYRPELKTGTEGLIQIWLNLICVSRLKLKITIQEWKFIFLSLEVYLWKSCNLH